MSQTIQRCPNCGAYVMSSDNICPRCDYPLDQPAPIEPQFEAVAEIFESDAAPADVDQPLIPAFERAEEVADQIEPQPQAAEAEAPADTTGPATFPDSPHDAAESDSEAAVSNDTFADELADVDDMSPPAPEADTESEPVDVETEEIVSEATDLDVEARAQLPTTRLPNALALFRGLLSTAKTDAPPVEAPEELDEAPPELPAFADEEAPDEEMEPLEAIPTLDEPPEEPEPAESIPEVLEAPDEPDSAPDIPARYGADITQARPLEQPAPRIEEVPVDSSEMPTAQLIPGEPPSSAERTLARPRMERPTSVIPPAPYTPPPAPAPLPPANIMPPAAYGYGAMQPVIPTAAAYLQQRVQDYRRSGYQLHFNSPYEASLSMGKSLGASGWLLALISVIGLVWYLLLMVLSVFRRDYVDIVLEADGQIYEDGSGAAHVRRQRARVGRRWAMFGVAIFVVSLLMLIVLALVAGAVLRNEQYQAALREAYPAITLFEEQFSPIEANPDDISTAKNGAVAFAIAAGIAAVGLWGGVTLWVIGTIHARAYRTTVSPLPGWG